MLLKIDDKAADEPPGFFRERVNLIELLLSDVPFIQRDIGLRTDFAC